ncbi:Asp-tRNA(Asn)/Glu-tRNA(Gln) amidotransferase subunit GatB [Telmatocola sphagniphila]|uniref:Aspartyl/glutamyl-tRNA(Asn/Gln) amidotransferase subunit B n=1 Tax=Telmatocola sphagniphila TaxID=1123043 RepID=A0A8E6EUX2_9BACT|nr:Asp-tRNA(Asn)/Glu-tRNA(Gln) amidotransferase subunit GatB [Telmatocola sphagniphila]QVL31960.1 Asp-tRNA(Asn)/Glu-tRNA(Gln) amidotransferase subunit GatB [Telmatocola sphagniphila]
MAEAEYEIVVGLETHVQLLTNTKLFCGCTTRFGAPPNSQVCPVCLGMPGSLPVMNRKAFDLSLKAALALNLQIAPFTKWDRKNYYYPDLPKNFQISQFDLPFSSEGYLEIDAGKGPRKIGIFRAHLEEDAGKSMHDESGRGGDTKVDLNRTGTPLLEIVSKPDISSPEEARAYLEELRLMLREIGVSDCEMQEGSLRCDANVNIRILQPDGSKIPTPIVEVKNLNSISSVERAIRHEAVRQYEQFKKDGERLKPGNKTTARWIEASEKTVVLRSKEESADYRYFPEPDLVPVVVNENQLKQARAEMGELPSEQRQRLQTQYGLNSYDSKVLTAKGRKLVKYYETVAAKIGDGKAVCNRISDLIFPALTSRNEEIEQFPISADTFADFLKQTATAGQDPRRKTFEYMLEHNSGIKEAMDALGIKDASSFDEASLRKSVLEAIAGNTKSVEDFKKGKATAANAILGAVMRANKGAPNELVRKILMEELAK